MHTKKIQNEAFNRRRREMRAALPHHGPTLRALRQRIGQTQAECATMLGVSLCSVSRWEVMANPLPANTWRQILKAYGMSQEAAETLCPPVTPPYSATAGETVEAPIKLKRYALYFSFERELVCVGFDSDPDKGDAVVIPVFTPRDFEFTTPGWKPTVRQRDAIVGWLDANIRPVPKTLNQNIGVDLI